MEQIKLLSYQEEKKLTNEELINYYEKVKQYYILKSKRKNNINEVLHPLVKQLMKTTKDFTIEIINQEKLKRNKTTIYAVNHSNFHDIPTICEIVEKHFVVLLGVQNLRLIDKVAFMLNGRIYVDRKNSKDKNNAKDEMINLSINDIDLLVFPEATWNVTENKLVLPLNWGIIDVAKISGAVIKPIDLEYISDKCYVNVGDDIEVDFLDDKKNKIDEVASSLSTLRWEVYEKMGIYSRKNITHKDLELYTKKRYEEYPKLNPIYEKSVIRKEYDSEEEVYQHLKTLKLTKYNCFLAKSIIDYVNKY